MEVDKSLETDFYGVPNRGGECMKTINYFMVPIVVALVLSGCSMVTSLNPVGTNPLQIKEDDWEGVWSNGELLFFVMAMDKDKGILRIAVVGKDKNQKDLTLGKFDAQLRQGKSSVFANILIKEFERGIANIREPTEEPNELIQNSYLWFMVKNFHGSIVIHFPNDNTFRQLVKEQKLTGKTVPTKNYWPDDIVICEPTDKITEFIDSHDDSGKLFEWKSPQTFRRISKFNE
jgi:hypothetical protein